MLMNDDTLQELITSVNALRESVDCLTDEVRASFGDDDDRVSFEPDFPLDGSELN